jgi:hypothetical protein
MNRRQFIKTAVSLAVAPLVGVGAIRPRKSLSSPNPRQLYKFNYLMCYWVLLDVSVPCPIGRIMDDDNLEYRAPNEQIALEAANMERPGFVY